MERGDAIRGGRAALTFAALAATALVGCSARTIVLDLTMPEEARDRAVVVAFERVADSALIQAVAIEAGAPPADARELLTLAEYDGEPTRVTVAALEAPLEQSNLSPGPVTAGGSGGPIPEAQLFERIVGGDQRGDWRRPDRRSPSIDALRVPALPRRAECPELSVTIARIPYEPTIGTRVKLALPVGEGRALISLQAQGMFEVTAAGEITPVSFPPALLPAGGAVDSTGELWFAGGGTQRAGHREIWRGRYDLAAKRVNAAPVTTATVTVTLDGSQAPAPTSTVSHVYRWIVPRIAADGSVSEIFLLSEGDREVDSAVFERWDGRRWTLLYEFPKRTDPTRQAPVVIGGLAEVSPGHVVAVKGTSPFVVRYRDDTVTEESLPTEARIPTTVAQLGAFGTVIGTSIGRVYADRDGNGAWAPLGSWGPGTRILSITEVPGGAVLGGYDSLVGFLLPSAPICEATHLAGGEILQALLLPGTDVVLAVGDAGPTLEAAVTLIRVARP